MNRLTRCAWTVALLASLAPRLVAGQESVGKSAVAIGSRAEMFLDDWLIDRMSHLTLQMQPPVRREIVLTTDQPWEGRASAYFTVLQDKDRIRLYYRGATPDDSSDHQITCYAESVDGVHFTRPNLGFVEFDGSAENNIIYRGVESHNFSPFLDGNPQTPADQRYKAVGGFASKLYAFASPDGIHWKKMQSEPAMTTGEFDSQNVAFWDAAAGRYRCYSRGWTEAGYRGFRMIQSCTSADFLHWDEPAANRYRGIDGAEPPLEHFYTNATLPCPGAPHHLLSFPMRFEPERTKLADAPESGVSDAVLLSSRDGVAWDRTFLEAWLRPGRDPRNWTHRSNMPAWGIVQTAPDEFSMYASEHYDWPEHRLRRLTVRRHGFAAVHAGRTPGELTTRPLTFTGGSLILNYATSAAGSVQVEVQDAQGQPIPGYALAEMKPLFGDELDAVVQWQSGHDLSSLAGTTIRLRFVLSDADLFSLRTETLVGGASVKAPTASTNQQSQANLSAADAKCWAERIGESVEDAVRRAAAGDKTFVESPAPRWTVTASGDEVAIAREDAVEMSTYVAGAPSPDEASRPIGKRSLRLVLRFAPPLPIDEYERLAAINQVSQDQEDRLRRRVADITHKFDDYLASTPEEKERLKAFREAASKLPRHKLPTFYAPDASVYLTYHWHPWAYPSDETVQAELRAIEERLVECFGLYDDDSWSRSMSIGEHVDVDLPGKKRLDAPAE